LRVNQVSHRYVRDTTWELKARSLYLTSPVASHSKNLHNWIQEILKNKGEPLPIILVGNKADLKGTTADDLSAEEIDRFRGDLEDWSGYDVAYMETSALTGLNVEDIFENIVESINMHISMSQGS
jgi:GTPase SAR1 family protein